MPVPRFVWGREKGKSNWTGLFVGSNEGIAMSLSVFYYFVFWRHRYIGSYEKSYVLWKRVKSFVTYWPNKQSNKNNYLTTTAERIRRINVSGLHCCDWPGGAGRRVGCITIDQTHPRQHISEFIYNCVFCTSPTSSWSRSTAQHSTDFLTRHIRWTGHRTSFSYTSKRKGHSKTRTSGSLWMTQCATTKEDHWAYFNKRYDPSKHRAQHDESYRVSINSYTNLCSLNNLLICRWVQNSEILFHYCNFTLGLEMILSQS
jgi:hypothetical protein